MRYYVKLINGAIIGAPRLISQSEGDSPNINWSKDQMKLNNFVEVDLNYNPETETIDLSSPIISGNSVTFPRTPFTQATILQKSKNETKKLITTMAKNVISNKYDEFTLLMVSMNLLPLNQKNDITSKCQTIVNSMLTMRNEVDALTTVESVKSYAISFPTI